MNSIHVATATRTRNSWNQKVTITVETEYPADTRDDQYEAAQEALDYSYTEMKKALDTRHG